MVESALRLLAEQAPDLVVLDVNLPTIGGFDVLAAIRSSSEVPVILLSGRIDEVDRVLGLELGADDYVMKPFSPRELASRVRAILRRVAPEAEPRAGFRRAAHRHADREKCSFAVRPFRSPRASTSS